MNRKKSFHEKYGWLTGPIAGIGLLLFLASFPALEWFQSKGYSKLADIAAGYMFGFVGPFAFSYIAKLCKGETDIFLNEVGVSRIVGIFSVGTVLLVGVTGMLLDLYGNTSGYYNTAFLIGGAICSGCLLPLIKQYD